MSTRFFSYRLTDWCNRLFGAEFGTGGLCGLATALDCDLDLVEPKEWKRMKDLKVKMGCVLPDMGLTATGDKQEKTPPFAPGFNNPATAELVYHAIHNAIDQAAEAGVKHVIVFTGMDTGADRNQQFQAIVDGFTKPLAEGGESLIQQAARLNIVLVMEPLNTLGDAATWRGHPGYLGHSTDEVVEKIIAVVNSPHLRLVYDVYHSVMMKENPIVMIERHHQYIAYVHFAGVATQGGMCGYQNRGELTSRGQSIDFARVCQKLAEHLPRGTPILLEYIPTSNEPARVQRDLADAIEECESLTPAA